MLEGESALVCFRASALLTGFGLKRGPPVGDILKVKTTGLAFYVSLPCVRGKLLYAAQMN